MGIRCYGTAVLVMKRVLDLLGNGLSVALVLGFFVWQMGPAQPAGMGGQGTSFQWGQLGLPSCKPGYILYNNNGQIGCKESGGGSGGSSALTKKSIAALNASTIYSAGTVTAVSNAYTAAAGAQPLPKTLASGQVYFLEFPSANTGPVTLVIGSFASQAVKIVGSDGADLTLVGGEIVAGPAILYYDGTQYLYATWAGARNIPVSGATAVTQANFANRDTFYLAAGNETLTFPCSTALSPNDQIFVFSTSGTATLHVAASPCADNIIKNGNTATTSQTVAQGAAAAIVLTDGAGNIYVSGS